MQFDKSSQPAPIQYTVQVDNEGGFPQLTILITFLAAVFTSSYTVPGSGRRKRPWPGLNSSGAIYCVPTYLRVFMASLRKKIEKNPSQPQYIQIHVGVGVPDDEAVRDETNNG